jgi:hypothetical protein
MLLAAGNPDAKAAPVWRRVSATVFGGRKKPPLVNGGF